MSLSDKKCLSFYTREGCGLCHESLALCQQLCQESGFDCEVIDIDQDPKLVQEYGNWVPVIALNGKVRLRGKISPAWLRRELKAFASAAQKPPKLRVSALIVLKHNLMLINKRPIGSYFGGWWEWPGGKCEPGEHPKACALREFQEEIGMGLENIRFFKKVEVPYPERSISLHVFIADYKTGSKPHDQALEHIWVKPEQVLTMKFLEPNRPILEHFIATRKLGSEA